MKDHDSCNSCHALSYSNEDFVLALLRGGRPTLLVGPLLDFEADAVDLGCSLTALVDDRQTDRALAAAGHETHLVDLNDSNLFGPLGDRLFEQVISPHLLQISADPVNLLRSLSKHLAPLGQLIFSAPNASHIDVMLATLLGQPVEDTTSGRPTRRFDMSTIEILLAGAGLWTAEIIEIHRPASPRLLELLRARRGPESVSEIESAHPNAAVFEWVVVAGPSPEMPRQQPLARRLIHDSTARSRVIDETTSYARSLEERLRASEVELANVHESHQAEIAALRLELEDAIRLEREVEWQREMVTELANRLAQSEVHIAEASKSYATALKLEETARRELVLTRRRIGFIVMDALAQRVYRHRILVLLLVRPIRRFVKRH